MTALRLFLRSFLPALLLISFSELRAQGDNNPTGVAGMFNGNVTTGCSYDPYTGNATRTITDIVVAGAVSDYGLSLSRTWNSRTPEEWQQSHQWSIEAEDSLPVPESYVVRYPDGREEHFAPSAADIYYRAAAGVRERLIPWTTTNQFAYLVQSDGGKIEFQGTRTYHQNDPGAFPPYWWEFHFTATAIIDPHGRRTTLSTNPDGSIQITDPTGRWIKVYYTPAGQVDYIKASDLREVHYTYQNQTFPPGTHSYSVLTNVAYYGDSSLNAIYTYQAPNVGDPDRPPLVATCDDPMYAGPMKKIAYSFRTRPNYDGKAGGLIGVETADPVPPAYGQLESEKSGTTGEVVTTLTMLTPDMRLETRSDGKTRTFTYSGGYLVSWTDFNNISASQTYDAAMYVASFTDRRGYITNFTHDPLTGAVTQVQYPATPNDTTPPTSARGTINYTYGGGGPTCTDPNNQDPYNPYYLCSSTDEAQNVTHYTRDANKQVTRIDYPDTGFETFGYNYSTAFGQMETHQMKTGGTESFTYNSGTGLRETFRNPDNAAGNPTARYQYDTLGRVSDITDTLGTSLGDPNHTTSYAYNTRGQVMVTTLPADPVDGVRHTIQNGYNSNDGTRTSVIDQLGHVTLYTYDDYRRLRTVTTPLRFAGDSTPRTTYFSYDRNQGAGDDYRHTDSNVTLLALPSTNIVKTFYDNNYLKTATIASAASGGDAATTSYGYDPAGNLTSVLMPDEQPGEIYYTKSTVSTYDERNRPMSVKDALDHYTKFTYDAGGRAKTITKPNQQPNGVNITFDTYDVMNRVTQKTEKQTAGLDAVTTFTYEPTGLHMTMRDPRLKDYTYEYDQMGRAKSLTYPADGGGAQRTESHTYDSVGRPGTFTNREGQVQTLSYDNLHRGTGFTWSAGASNVTVVHDAANRVTSITNADATVSREYYNDNLLKAETQAPAGGSANTVTYAYAADGNRESILYPSLKKYRYNYTGRGQLKQVQDNYNNSFTYQAEYVYDVNGNLATRKVGTNLSVITDASQRDAMGRVTHLEHRLAGTTRTFDYIYNEMGDRTSAQEDGGAARAFGYDFAEQVTSAVDAGMPYTWGYDANGNRTGVNGSGIFVTNNLNQATTFNGVSATYSLNGNTASYGSSIYLYDAQNRMTSATNSSGVVSTFKYDGLNRKVSQTIGGVTTYNIWDGWSLIEERGSGNALLNSYVYGAGEIVERITGTTQTLYFQDGLGSTSHVSDAAGNLTEYYRYTSFGIPNVYGPAGALRRNGSTQDVRHLFTSQLWMPQTTLYDYRNRVYSPSLTRFLQPDPIGFNGDPSNLYRYCGNNAVDWSDPSGLFLQMYGFQVTGATLFGVSGSFQVGYTMNGWNPLNWTVGYATGPSAFLSSNEGVAASYLQTFTLSNASFSDLKGLAGEAGGSLTLPILPGTYAVGSQVGNFNVFNPSQPLTFTQSLTWQTPNEKGNSFGPVGGFLGASYTHTGEVSVGELLSAIGSFFQNIFSPEQGGFGGVPDNDPSRVIVVGTPIPSGSGFAGATLGGMLYGGGPYAGAGPNGFGGLGSGFGGIGGAFDFGSGRGIGFGGVGNNSPGVDIGGGYRKKPAKKKN
ncbi:MAG: RHS repeat-associated core domain-containing protein [Chthoniobacterales bacterium]